jgi:S1-C subfamily serine protease
MTFMPHRIRVAFVVCFGLALSAFALALATAARAVGSTGRASDATGAVVNIYTRLGYSGSAAAGTGIVIGSSGLVLTNNHVIRGATTLHATDVGNGRTYTATVLGYSIASDVALLQLKNASGLQTATIGGNASVGQAVTAYGNAQGAGGQPAAAPGTVKAVGQSITASDDQGDSERLTGLIRTNAPLEPGDSGGPLVDSNGRVVGMDTAASTSFQFSFQQTATQAFAIPIAHALAVAKQIQSGKGTATVHVGPTAMLGVNVQSPDTYGFGSYGSNGALVVGVVPGSPADNVGVSEGSVITSIGGKSIKSPTQLANVMLAHAPKDTVAITWLDGFGARTSATARLAVGPPQ